MSAIITDKHLKLASYSVIILTLVACAWVSINFFTVYTQPTPEIPGSVHETEELGIDDRELQIDIRCSRSSRYPRTGQPVYRCEVPASGTGQLGLRTGSAGDIVRAAYEQSEVLAQAVWTSKDTNAKYRQNITWRSIGYAQNGTAGILGSRVPITTPLTAGTYQLKVVMNNEIATGESDVTIFKIESVRVYTNSDASQHEYRDVVLPFQALGVLLVLFSGIRLGLDLQDRAEE